MAAHRHKLRILPIFSAIDLSSQQIMSSPASVLPQIDASSLDSGLGLVFAKQKGPTAQRLSHKGWFSRESLLPCTLYSLHCTIH
jgi:hypothetical protein